LQPKEAKFTKPIVLHRFESNRELLDQVSILFNSLKVLSSSYNSFTKEQSSFNKLVSNSVRELNNTLLKLLEVEVLEYKNYINNISSINESISKVSNSFSHDISDIFYKVRKLETSLNSPTYDDNSNRISNLESNLTRLESQLEKLKLENSLPTITEIGSGNLSWNFFLLLTKKDKEFLFLACPADFKEFNGYCIHYPNKTNNNKDALGYCESLNSTLAVINDQKKIDYFRLLTNNSNIWVQNLKF
jgi:hypothetical protein